MMIVEKKKKRSGDAIWMITFADLLSLLLTFFVLIFSMNAVQYEDWEAVVKALREKLNPLKAQLSSEQIENPQASKIYEPAAISLSYLATIIGRKTTDDPVMADVSVLRMGDRLLLSFPSTVLFEKDGATLKKDARRSLARLGAGLADISNGIMVGGHTDPSPPIGLDFDNNWDLSLAQAVQVAAVIHRAGYSRNIPVYGLADTRFNDLDPDLLLDERYRLARRVDLIFSAQGKEDMIWQ